MKTLYSTQATVTGGRTGNASLKDSDLTINMVAPGSGKDGNNPEQLFAMGYAACFDGALAAVKGEEKAKDMKFETFNNRDVIINTAAAKKINMTISKDVQKQAKQTFDKIRKTEK